MLQSKAKEIAQRLHIYNFQVINGWLESFRARHDINLRSVSGESAGVDLEAAEDWKSKLNQVEVNTHQKISVMQMRQDCSLDKCPGKAWVRKGKM
jgi:hypothetical protein